MAEPQITQEALDRLEGNLRTVIAEAKAHMLLLRDADNLRYEQRFKDSGTAVQAALGAADRAVMKAEGAAEKRFEGVNEFRQTLADQQRTLIPRAEAEVRMGTIEARLTEIKRDFESRLVSLVASNTERSGKEEGAKITWAYIIGAAGLLLSLWTFAMRFKP